MARLIFQLGDGKTVDFKLAAAVVTLGRSTSNDIVINNGWISSHHAKFERSGGTIEVTSLGTLHGIPLKEYKRVGGVYTVIDLDSHNGVVVNGKRVASQALKSGDVLAFGQLDALFEDLPEPSTEAPVTAASAEPPPDSATPDAISTPPPEPSPNPPSTPPPAVAAPPAPMTDHLQHPVPVLPTSPLPLPTSKPAHSSATASPRMQPEGMPHPPVSTKTAKTALASIQRDVAHLEKALGALQEMELPGADAAHSMARGLIQRVDLLEDLMSAGEQSLPGVRALLGPLHASLLELLRDHSIEPFTIPHGQSLDVATRKRITIVEAAPEGEGLTEIAEVFRPGYVFTRGSNDLPAVILRKAEVRTLRRQLGTVT